MTRQTVFRETIFALSSGGLPSGVAVIRISGDRAREVVESICHTLPSERRARFVALHGADGGVIDRGLALYFPGPASFTGEDCAELHLHGGHAVVESMLRELGGRPGLRLAEAGEFTRRAFLNGKVDLTEAEALSDLIAAETELQRRLAVANAAGDQRKLYEAWRTRVLRARAMVEALLDFSDQEDVPGDDLAAWHEVSALALEITEHLEGFGTAEIIREGFDVVILGAPNVGKSSLLNALARRDVAIVTEEAGTTRDLLEVALDVAGAKVRVTDTAGIREASGEVERIGIERALRRALDAELVVELHDLRDPELEPVRAEFRDILRVGTKLDLIERDLAAGVRSDLDCAISSRTGEGLDGLVALIGERVSRRTRANPGVIPTRQRHRDLLSECARRLTAAATGMQGGPELRAEELRAAGDCLGKLTGRIDTEEVLGEIFSAFCVGK